jgi:dynein heavy chain 2
MVNWEFGPEKPLSWIRELVRKRIVLSKWKSAAMKSSLFDDPISLKDLFNPATFINALRQQTARKLGAAIDRVKLSSSWENEGRKLKKLCPLTCQLSGLLLQGATFPSGVLRESSSDGSELSPAPNVTVGFVLTEDAETDADSLSVPLYLNTSRESQLIDLEMPVANMEDKSRWVLAGVALFLSDDD